jgi:tetratricopeptide (TPR) repeat protein
VPYDLLGWCYEAKGDLTGAIAEFQKARAIEPVIADPLASLGRAYALQKRYPEARKVIDQLKELSIRNHVPPYNLAWIYAALGEKDQALAMLDKAYDERSWYIVLLAVDPKFENLRSDPRFADLVRRVGLPQ